MSFVRSCELWVWARRARTEWRREVRVWSFGGGGGGGSLLLSLVLLSLVLLVAVVVVVVAVPPSPPISISKPILESSLLNGKVVSGSTATGVDVSKV